MQLQFLRYTCASIAQLLTFYGCFEIVLLYAVILHDYIYIYIYIYIYLSLVPTRLSGEIVKINTRTPSEEVPVA